MDQKIFIVVVVSGHPDPESLPEYNTHKKNEFRMRSRCWGFYFDRVDAEHVIEHNETDISELGYYRYAVLSEVGEGPLAIPDELQWYEFIWDWDVPPRKDGVVIPMLTEVRRIGKPQKYERFFFGIS